MSNFVDFSHFKFERREQKYNELTCVSFYPHLHLTLRCYPCFLKKTRKWDLRETELFKSHIPGKIAKPDLREETSTKNNKSLMFMKTSK